MKLFEGGWFPLLLAGLVAFLMLTWRKGNQLVEAARVPCASPRPSSWSSSGATRRSPCRATPPSCPRPPAPFPLHLSRFVERSHALHKRILIVTALYEEEPAVPREQRAEVIADHARHHPRDPALRLHGGCLDPRRPALRGGVRAPAASECLDDLTIFIGHETIIPKSDHRGMATWREEIYAFLLRNAERTGAHFCVPTRQLVEVGTEIEI